MNTSRTAWAAWHPVKGFDEHVYEGPVAFAGLHSSLRADVRELNERDGTNNRNGWRAVRVVMERVK
jgi:hypothetical protein